jgi:hypothetical protein
VGCTSALTSTFWPRLTIHQRTRTKVQHRPQME